MASSKPEPTGRDSKVVHYDWADSADVQDSCREGPTTNLLSAVTCRLCQKKMVEVVRGWFSEEEHIQ